MNIRRPWIFHLGPFIAPYMARAELDRLSDGLTRDEFVDKCWQLRTEAAKPVQGSRRKGWPRTCKVGKVYVLPGSASNVTTLKRRAKP